MAQYGRLQYWDERYQVDKECFSWYQKYSGFRHLLTPEFLSSDTSTFPDDRKKTRVLVLGCGNDDLSEQMLEDNWGWEGGIVNVDFSSVVIEQMREKYDDTFHASLKERLSRERKLRAKQDGANGKDDGISFTNMTFDCADCTKTLPYADSSFDLIICKGTLDAILCSAGSNANARSIMEESSRLLNNEHGVMVTVSHGNKDSRLVYFENPSDEWWKGGVTFHTVPKPVVEVPGLDERGLSPYHYVIIAKKNGNGGPAQGNSNACYSPNSVTNNDENAINSLNNRFGKGLLLGIPEEKSNFVTDGI